MHAPNIIHKCKQPSPPPTPLPPHARHHSPASFAIFLFFAASNPLSSLPRMAPSPLYLALRRQRSSPTTWLGTCRGWRRITTSSFPCLRIRIWWTPCDWLRRWAWLLRILYVDVHAYGDAQDWSACVTHPPPSSPSHTFPSNPNLTYMSFVGLSFLPKLHLFTAFANPSIFAHSPLAICG